MGGGGGGGRRGRGVGQAGWGVVRARAIMRMPDHASRPANRASATRSGSHWPQRRADQPCRGADEPGHQPGAHLDEVVAQVGHGRGQGREDDHEQAGPAGGVRVVAGEDHQSGHHHDSPSDAQQPGQHARGQAHGHQQHRLPRPARPARAARRVAEHEPRGGGQAEHPEPQLQGGYRGSRQQARAKQPPDHPTERQEHAGAHVHVAVDRVPGGRGGRDGHDRQQARRTRPPLVQGEPGHEQRDHDDPATHAEQPGQDPGDDTQHARAQPPRRPGHLGACGGRRSGVGHGISR